MNVWSYVDASWQLWKMFEWIIDVKIEDSNFAPIRYEYLRRFLKKHRTVTEKARVSKIRFIKLKKKIKIKLKSMKLIHKLVLISVLTYVHSNLGKF